MIGQILPHGINNKTPPNSVYNCMVSNDLHQSGFIGLVEQM